LEAQEEVSIMASLFGLEGKTGGNQGSAMLFLT